MDHVKRASELFLEGYNCSQAVSAAFSDVVGIPEETLLRLSCAFGGGLARTRNLCGAVSGIAIVLGLLYSDTTPDAKIEMYKITRKLTDQFENAFHSLNCGDNLKNVAGIDNSVMPQKRTPEYYKNRPCLLYVEYAAELIEKEIESHQ